MCRGVILQSRSRMFSCGWAVVDLLMSFALCFFYYQVPKQGAGTAQLLPMCLRFALDLLVDPCVALGADGPLQGDLERGSPES
jgi:hypothetical protein